MNTGLNHTDRAHSPFGGSSAKRVMNCPGSVRLCQQYPNTGSSFATEGTAIHEAIDFIFQGRAKEDSDVVGLTFNDVEITQAIFDDAIEPALERYDAVEKELGGIEYYNECRVDFKGIKNSFGTVDIIGTAKDRSIVLDWKFGRGVAVSAVENEQLMYYAYSAMYTKPVSAFFDKAKPIELFIVQPMVRDGEPFTRWTTTGDQLEAFAAAFIRAAKKSETHPDTFNMGSWCKFCNGKPGCPLYQNTAQDLIALPPEELSSQFEKYAPLFDAMIEWGKAGKDLMHQEMDKGLKVHGWKLVQKRAIRKWVDEKKADAFLARNQIPAADRHVKKLITPAVAEKVLKKNGGRALTEGLVEKVSSGTTLALASDKRAEVTLTSNSLQKLASRLQAG